MPKMKTHSGMSKRVRVTAGGKVMHQPAGKVHKLEAKSSTRKRRLSGVVEVSKAEAKKIKKMLGR
jgi:large subunit ribosomal protein L35